MGIHVGALGIIMYYGNYGSTLCHSPVKRPSKMALDEGFHTGFLLWGEGGIKHQ